MNDEQVHKAIQDRLRVLENLVHPGIHTESYEEGLELIRSKLEQSDSTLDDAVVLCDLVCELMVLMAGMLHGPGSKACAYVEEAVHDYKRRLGDYN